MSDALLAAYLLGAADMNEVKRERDALRARVAELEARWAAVPWIGLRIAMETYRADVGLDGSKMAWPHIAHDWLNANQPDQETQP